MIHDDPEYLRDPRIKATCAPLVAAAEAAASTWCSCAWTMTAEHRSAGQSTHQLVQVDPACRTHGTGNRPQIAQDGPGGSGECSATPEGAGGATGPSVNRARLREAILEGVDVRIAYGEPVWTIDEAGLDQVLDAAYDALVAERDELRRQVQAARELHVRLVFAIDGGPEVPTDTCLTCEKPWPCPTIQAIGGE